MVKEFVEKAGKAVKETVDGIRQDPEALGRDVANNAVAMADTIKNTGRRAADATKRVVDENIVQPVDQNVVQPIDRNVVQPLKKSVATLRETVQGIAQDPKAFGREVVGTASSMVDKATAPIRNAGRKVAGVAQQGIASVKGALGKAAQKTGEHYEQVQELLVRLGRDVKGFAELPKDQQLKIAEGFLKDLQKAGKDGIDASKGFIASKVAGVKGALKKAMQPVKKAEDAIQGVSKTVEITMKGLERDIEGFKNLTSDQKRQIAEAFVRDVGENATKLWGKAKDSAILAAAAITGKEQ